MPSPFYTHHNDQARAAVEHDDVDGVADHLRQIARHGSPQDVADMIAEAVRDASQN